MEVGRERKQVKVWQEFGRKCSWWKNESVQVFVFFSPQISVTLLLPVQSHPPSKAQCVCKCGSIHTAIHVCMCGQQILVLKLSDPGRQVGQYPPSLIGPLFSHCSILLQQTCYLFIPCIRGTHKRCFTYFKAFGRWAKWNGSQYFSFVKTELF